MSGWPADNFDATSRLGLSLVSGCDPIATIHDAASAYEIAVENGGDLIMPAACGLHWALVSNGQRSLDALGVGALLKPENGLNLVRLALVALVVLSHSYTVGQYGPSPVLFGNTPGGWALAGLFAVSGFLVSSGRLRRTYLTYFAHRVLRLWPAYLVCLLVIVALFAPTAYVLQHGTIDGYLTAPHGPGRFLSLNALLEIREYDLAGTPGTDKYGWIGNLWTIFYTVLSYAVVGVLLGIRDVRTRLNSTLVAFVVLVVAYANIDWILVYIQDPRFGALLRFLPFFVGGSLVYQLRDRLRLTLPFGTLALTGAFGIVAVNGDWGLQAAAPLLAYGLLAIGNELPAPSFLRAHDFAMGVFMYSYAVQSLLLVLAVNEFAASPWMFFGLSLLATFPFALASWFLVERPVVRSLRQSERRPVGAPVEVAG